MAAGTYNFTIEQGTTWSKTFYFAQGNVGLVLPVTSTTSITVDATATTFVRDDTGGSWIDDGLTNGDYLVISGFLESENNGSHIITTLTASTITCVGSTLVDEIVSPVDTNAQIIILKAKDLTGYTGAAMIRKKYSSTSAAATITITFNVTRESGTIALSLTNTQTSAITAGENSETSASQYVWDLEFTKSAVVTRMLKGIVAISPEATK
jgi:hypothetical protein